MRCDRCGALYRIERGLIVHVEGCPGTLVDSEVFGVGVEYIEPL